MTAHELPLDAASYLMDGASANLNYQLLRAGSLRWSEADLRDLKLFLPFESLLLWKFTRVLTTKDGVLGSAAQQLAGGKHQGKTFGRWPRLQEHIVHEEEYSVDTKSFVLGAAELTEDQALEESSELLSLINYPGGFDGSGLAVFRGKGSSPLPPSKAEVVDSLLRTLMSYQARNYTSQESWDRDLKAKEKALNKAAVELVNHETTLAVPLINANVEVSLLVCRSRGTVRGNENDIKPLPAGEISEWEIGLFR